MELFYTIDINDSELDKKLSKISDLVKVANKDFIQLEQSAKNVDLTGLDTSNQAQSLTGLSLQIRLLKEVWDNLKFEDKFTKGEDGALKMTESANQLLDKYKSLITQQDEYGKGLSQLLKLETDLAKQQSKEQGSLDKQYAKIVAEEKKQLAKEVAEEEKTYTRQQLDDEQQMMQVRTTIWRNHFDQIEQQEQERINKATELEKQRLSAVASSIGSMKDTSINIFNLDESSYESTKTKIDEIKQYLLFLDQNKSKIDIDDKELEVTNKTIKELKDNLDRLQSSFRSKPLGDLLKMNPQSIEESNRLISELRIRRDQLTNSDANYSRNLAQLNKRMIELGNSNQAAIKHTSEFKKGISSLGAETQKTGIFASELVNTLKTFAGFYFAKDAVKQLIEVSGQFELQLVSLKAITQSVEGATKLFSQFQTLSVKSPFQFSEILAGAKQLAAFQIPLKDLYQTTKVITDLSAGLGVDMGRIILAYGQIQAASVLRGQEVRQLTEAGIPVIQLLADKFSLLEERVVSTNEVFDKISARMVPFEMIKEIFTDLTSEGGAFFNMQEKQADTLYGKVSNLKDAYQIMLNDIGSANNELLKGAVEIPMTLMQNWEQVGDAIAGLVITYGTFKAVSTTFKVIDMAKDFGSLSKAIRSTTIAQKALNSTLLTNPWVLLATAIAAVGSAMVFTYINSQRLNNELSKINTEGLSGVENTVSKFDELYNKLKQAKEGSQEFRNAIKAINNQYGEYLPNLLTESNALSELAVSYDKVTQAIYNKAKAQSAEKGFAAIQEEYGSVQEDAVSRLMDSLISSGVPKDKAKDLLKLFRTELEKQTVEYNPYDLFNKVYEGYFDTTKKYFSDTEVLLKNMTQTGGEAITNLGDVITGKVDFKNLVADVYKLSDATKDVKEKTGDFGEQLDLTYSKSTAKTAEEADRMKGINDQYAKLNKIFYENSQSQEEWNETVKKLDYSKLAATVRMYEELQRPEMVKELKKQLAALGDVQDGWRGIVTEALKANKAGSIYKPQKDESQFDYIDRLKKAYKEVSEQIKTMASLSIFSPEEKVRLEQQKSALEAVAAVMGTSLLTDKTANKERKTAADLLKEESDLIKKVYADYDKLRKFMGDTAAQEEIKMIYSGLMQPESIPFDADTYKKQLTDIAAKLQKLDVKAATDVKLVITDEDIKELEKRIKYALDKSAKEIERHKDQYDIYKQLIEKGFSEGRAHTLAFGVEFTVAQGGYDIGKFLADQLEQTLSVAIPGVSIDFDADTTFVDQIGTAYDGLNEDLKKQVISLEKFRSDEQKNSFLKYATLVKKETPEGMGLQFDLSNVFAKYKEELTNIQADAKLAMSSVEYKKASAPEATVEQKSEKEAVDRNVQLQIEANQKVALDKAKKLGSVYLQERMEIAGLGEMYKNMSTASSTSLRDMLEVVNQAMSDLLTGTNEKLEESGLSEFAGYFEQAFNAENATDYAEQMTIIADDLSRIPPEAAQGLGFTPEMIQKAIQFAAAQRSVALNTQSASNEIKAVDSKRIISAYQNIADSTKEIIDSVKGLGEAFGIEFDDISKAAMDMVGDIVDSSMDVITEIESTAKLAGEGMSLTAIMASESISTVEKASVILAVIGAALKVAMAIANLFATKAKKKNQDIIKDSEAQIKRLEDAYADLGRAADKALGTDVYKQQADQIKNLGQQQKELQKQLATEGKKGGLSAEEADEIRRQMVELGQEQEDMIDSIRDNMIGTVKDIADELGNAFFDAFAAGEDYAVAWGEKVDEIVGDILKKMLIQKLLEKPLGDALDRFSNTFIDKTTGKVNVDKMLSGLDEFAEEANAIGGTFSEAIQRAIAENPELAKYLTGEGVEEGGKGTAQAIQGVTEDTANILGGYMNGIRAESVIHTGIFNSIYELLQQRLIITDNPIIQLQLNVMNQQLVELQAIKTILNDTLGAAFDAASGRIKVG